MIIGERLRLLREKKNLSQGDIEKSTGLLRCYISRVENGHTVPAIETLEKLARAMSVPLYQLFYDGDEAVPLKLARKETKLDRRSKQAMQVLERNIAALTTRDKTILVRLSSMMARRAA